MEVDAFGTQRCHTLTQSESGYSVKATSEHKIAKLFHEEDCQILFIFSTWASMEGPSSRVGLRRNLRHRKRRYGINPMKLYCCRAGKPADSARSNPKCLNSFVVQTRSPNSFRAASFQYRILLAICGSSQILNWSSCGEVVDERVLDIYRCVWQHFNSFLDQCIHQQVARAPHGAPRKRAYSNGSKDAGPMMSSKESSQPSPGSM